MKPTFKKRPKKAVAAMAAALLLAHSVAFADDDDDGWQDYGQPYGWYQPQTPPLVVEVPGLRVEMPVGNGYYRQR